MKQTLAFFAIALLGAAGLAAQGHGRGGRAGAPGPTTGGGLHHGTDLHQSGPRATHTHRQLTAESRTQTRLSENTRLASRLQPMLPPNTDMRMAAQGFKNLGQFVAAVHVSNNLGIPFDQLKTRMTGPDHVSLGQAIHELRPNMTDDAAKDAARAAERQAKADIRKAQREPKVGEQK